MRLRHRVVGSSAIGARRRRGLLVLASAVAAITAFGACSNSPGKSAGPVPTLTGDCAKYQAYAGHAGTKVTMFASIISPESDSLQTSWSEFSKCTGITISYEGANDFESQLPVRVTGGNAPDLAIIPQPGLLQQMVKSGKVAKPADQTVANVDKYWNKSWKAYGTVNGTFYAAPMSANMKSLVWYSPKAFTAAGASPRIGARLGMILRQAGLEQVTTFGVQAYLPPQDKAGAALLAGVARAVAPVIVEHGIATAEQLGLDTLEDRIAAEFQRADAVMLPPTVVGARGAVTRG